MNNQDETLKLENQLCFPLYAASKEVVKQYHPFLEKLNLTYTQYITMMVFWEHKKINVKELGKKLYLDSGTLTPVLKILETKGYIKRYRSSSDERIVFAEITEAGEKLKKSAYGIPEQVASCVKLKPEEAFQLYSLLHKLLENIREEN